MTIIHPDDRDEFPWTAHVADLEQQRDQAIAERDDALRRLADAEARINRLVAFFATIIAEYEEVHPMHVPPLARTLAILHPGDLDPIATAPAPED